MQSGQLEQIVAPLLAWYRANRRSLPWREDTDPYRVWVSEIMLQQTRVEAVIPYYERFMKRCPDIASLAACKEDELLKLWEGLGYYSRVRNMKKAAQVLCSDYQGSFPQEAQEIAKLPGIGAYTAGAIASIAFEKAAAAVDGNVLRVVTRLTEDSRDIADAKFRRQMTETLEAVYPKEGRGDFTQSLMELGAVVCAPNKAPKCAVCPIWHLCGAYAHQTQQQYPVKKQKAARKIQQKTVLILCREGRIALRKRGSTGVLAGMWELPNLDGEASRQELAQWISARNLAVKRFWEPKQGKGTIKHIFTHIEWHMCYRIAVCESIKAQETEAFTWVTKKQLETEAALPTAFKKVYEAACKEFAEVIFA